MPQGARFYHGPSTPWGEGGMARAQEVHLRDAGVFGTGICRTWS